MKSPLEPQLNQFHVLRYDGGHQGIRDGAQSPQEIPDRQSGHADMDVNGPGSVQGSFPIKPSRTVEEVPQTSAAKPIETSDKVEISSAGKMLENLNNSPEVRAERLAQIKAAIDAGEYETPDKLEAALAKMLREIGIDDET